LRVTGLDTDGQRLLFAGRQLADSTVLTEAGVSEDDTLHILARLLGGAKKRKKKTYTKPKKQKHKHKKIKLRVLKFFKVGGPCLASRNTLRFSVLWFQSGGFAGCISLLGILLVCHRWMTLARCSACASLAPHADRAFLWPPTSTASTGMPSPEVFAPNSCCTRALDVFPHAIQ
jgi:hypothetical protein